MELFDDARLLELRGASEAAREKYEAAALLEEQCVESIGDDEPLSRGIVGVGAVSLWMRAGKLDHAEELVRLYLSRPIGPGFERELLELLNEVRRKRDETSAAPVEPDERATLVVDALRKVEEDLGAGRVRFWSIKGIKSAA
ncbi:MAG TPA: hypothetical protein VF395_18160 [Polyangiaceae bacterium]